VTGINGCSEVIERLLVQYKICECSGEILRVNLEVVYPLGPDLPDVTVERYWCRSCVLVQILVCLSGA
jgi:hypothetical protein